MDARGAWSPCRDALPGVAATQRGLRLTPPSREGPPGATCPQAMRDFLGFLIPPQIVVLPETLLIVMVVNRQRIRKRQGLGGT